MTESGFGYSSDDLPASASWSGGLLRFFDPWRLDTRPVGPDLGDLNGSIGATTAMTTLRDLFVCE